MMDKIIKLCNKWEASNKVKAKFLHSLGTKYQLRDRTKKEIKAIAVKGANALWSKFPTPELRSEEGKRRAKKRYGINKNFSNNVSK